MRISDWSSDVCSSDLDERLPWLEQVRRFDLLLRGPRPPAGLAGIDQLIALRRNPLPQKEGGGGLSVWWAEVRVILAPLEAAIVQGIPLPGQLAALREAAGVLRSEEHTSELQSLMRISYAVFCLKKKTHQYLTTNYYP